MRKHYFIYRVVCSINNITIHLTIFQEQLGMILIATLKFFLFGNKYYTYQQSKYTLAKMLRWIVTEYYNIDHIFYSLSFKSKPSSMKLCFLCNDVFTLRKILKKYIFRYINGPHWNFVITFFNITP